MISDAQKAANAAGAIATGLVSLNIPVPLTTVQWADQHYYLPKESSYTPGQWETLPFQVAIMNSMGNDRIRTVNLIKSARVGYTKMLLGVEAYFIEHKSRNSLLFQPTDSAAEDFMKSHVEPTIRDVPVLLELAPWFGRKHRDNTLTLKRFSSGVGFWCLGGAAAKNYREKSVDVVCYDELSSFEPDVEKEGSPTLLGDKRIEGSVWPKSIRGSTPKIKGFCQIEKAANESAHFMRFYVPCPHCGEAQYLKFGDDATTFGLKWEKGKPETVYYLCEHNGCVIRQSELDQTDGRWICDNTGMWTRDGLTFYSAGDEEIPPPRSISYHIWTAYSPFTTWVQIVYDWLDALKDPNGVKTFINTTLGEPYEEAVAEKLSFELLLEKVCHYDAQVPLRVVYLTAGIDSQKNRYEIYVWGWAPGEEAFLIDKQIIMGRPEDEDTLKRVDAVIRKKYRHADGTEISISRVCWDTGGIDQDIVYQRSRKHGTFFVLPIKGASVYGKPVITMPKKRNQRGVFLCEVGSDTVKEMLYARFALPVVSASEVAPYTFRFPDNPDIFSDVEAKQLVAEELVEKVVNGRVKLQWDARKRRNEALDCLVYAYAALRISVQRWQLDLDALARARRDEQDDDEMTIEEIAAALSGG
ncbi:phage terminase large subunit family protein [Escherichia coli]|uniref:Phage terminase large subunit family protein n=5 Tax=Escherichia coli TaxID=562 RepID=A0A0Q3H336_ECOLX|nr:phage terminase large subunit family protein [Escherichia coli]EKK2499494.1 phage terminase large subunit family protein [Escherichia coli O142]KAE9912889.1 phage terminase large subunit family protein [Enterobacteriaceae bacterium TzEc051]EER3119572.1 phage terminase large subunit family protein [Escherichia coli]EER6573949.1 phage terminase large subunit family protein [Escherichia coli]EEU1875197.1 phage terminase large subunit family protein [Escherichia coli]